MGSSTWDFIGKGTGLSYLFGGDDDDDNDNESAVASSVSETTSNTLNDSKDIDEISGYDQLKEKKKKALEDEVDSGYEETDTLMETSATLG